MILVIVVVVLALVFGYTNGFHDTANAIATSVSTRALTPRIALALAAVANFAGALIGALLGQQVARTVSDTIGDIGSDRGLVVVLAGLLGAIAWNLATWYRGLPSSSSYALIGGLVGAALAGGAAVHWQVVLTKVLVPMVVAPVAGFAVAFALMIAILWMLRRARPQRVNRGFRMLQTVSAAALAVGHGLQDAQKTMGVIFLALIASGHASSADDLPLWVILTSAAAISLGTYSGGWRIMHTLGRRIIDLDPARGFSAEVVGAGILYVTAFVFHTPISTTQTITSAIAGAGATRRISAVRWAVARSIALAWVLTLPAAAVIAALAYGVLRLAQLP